ncbi:MAG: ABC transporter permease subunit [Chloroflexi bacterium AL-W]|nr:ABC transporter permease subunit [Chloroflexi bacterium AL-N1]NOK67091.1 ABC transporter permease subunit [Chloroflexi bacterium AL-N10]NOK74616.1 ABC transporter permease subunit [Chloroflexi bacterium AL-N5]NOK81693.1 ABC transporter permease subunit [Chloroflexi bacterium AL-W]NOK89163.1 ABC transporter permease subunit [Chloroflexi bacterium AL-N15]
MEVAQPIRRWKSYGRRWHIVIQQCTHDLRFMLSLIGLLSISIVVILAPWVSPHDPIQIDADRILQAPSWEHPFGTDDLGRDILSRLLWGGRESLRVALLSVLMGVTAGTLLGLVAGYRGGWIDSICMRLVDILLAFPDLLIILSIIAILGPGLNTTIVALSLVYIPGFTRLIRGSVLALRSLDYLVAAQALGIPHWRIMLHHILPNILPIVIVYSSIGLAGAILIAAGLSYLGLGAQPPSPEWGAMLNEGRIFLHESWWMSVFPGCAIFIVVICINLLGDSLQHLLHMKQT